MPATYKTHLLCSKCGIYVRKEDVEKVSYRSKTGSLLHECGWQYRTQGRRRNNPESLREDALRNKPIILPTTIRQDIKLNKEKWENLLKSEA